MLLGTYIIANSGYKEIVMSGNYFFFFFLGMESAAYLKRTSVAGVTASETLRKVAHITVFMHTFCHA